MSFEITTRLTGIDNLHPNNTSVSRKHTNSFSCIVKFAFNDTEWAKIAFSLAHRLEATSDVVRIEQNIEKR